MRRKSWSRKGSTDLEKTKHNYHFKQEVGMQDNLQIIELEVQPHSELKQGKWQHQ